MKYIQRKFRILFASIGNRNVKLNLQNALPYWTGSFIIGIISVIYAKLFSLAEEGTKYIFDLDSRLFFIVTPIAFVSAWWIVKKFAPFARGSGIPQVTASIELTNPSHFYKVDKLLSIRIIIVKVVSSLVMVFGGGVVGREGPTIQISASIFKKINDWLPEWYPKISRRNMIVTGAAAGLASAFNTPLGGIVFAIEELTKTHFSYFKSALLTGVIIAGLTSLHFLGPYLYLGYPAVNNINLWLIIVVIPVSILTGVCGSGMGRILLFIFRKKRAFIKDRQLAVYAIVCGLIVAVLAYYIDHRMLGSGKDIMVTALFSKDKSIEWYVPLLRMIGPIISFSTGSAGGIFAPSLSAGASIGALVSGWLHLTGSETNLIVLCGMVGILTGITRSPFTSSILVIEMTSTHNIIFYLMLSGLFANIFSNLVSKHSFYDYLKDQYIHDIHLSEIQEERITKQLQPKIKSKREMI
ncbi:chloride channel protein [soil metagenome]